VRDWPFADDLLLARLRCYIASAGRPRARTPSNHTIRVGATVSPT